MVSSEGSLANLKTIGESLVVYSDSTGWTKDKITYTKVSEEEANGFEPIKETEYSCKLCGKGLDCKNSDCRGRYADYIYYCRNCNFRVDINYYNYFDG